MSLKCLNLLHTSYLLVINIITTRACQDFVASCCRFVSCLGWARAKLLWYPAIPPYTTTVVSWWRAITVFRMYWPTPFVCCFVTWSHWLNEMWQQRRRETVVEKRRNNNTNFPRKYIYIYKKTQLNEDKTAKHQTFVSLLV